MKFSILQQDLLPVLQAVSRSVGIRSTLPVLDNILLATDGKKLKLAATNLEIGVIKFLSVDVLEEGEITIPAKTLLELISGLGQNKIEIESKEEVLAVQAGRFKAQINGIIASEFPAIPTSESKGVVFPKEAILGCSQILFAAAVDEGRPVLTGILTQVNNDKLDFVATDGFRLSHRTIKLAKTKDQLTTLIPKRTFEEVLRILSEEDVEDLSIATSDNQNQVIFKIGQTIASSRLIEGQFPSWEKIIPQNIITRVITEREELLKAIKLAAIFAKNEANILVLTVQEKSLSIKSSAKEIGSQENEIEGQVEGEDLQIAFNAKFLQDALSAASSTQIMIEFSGPLSPTLIKPIGMEGLEYIIMPVRLS